MVLMSPATRIFTFFWGALWGSFLNVVIHRVPRGLSVVRPRSRCPQCETTIAGYDNIPIVSYLWLRGQCRHCKAPVPIRYLFVEVLAGVLSFALYMQLVYVPLLEGGGPALLAWTLWLGWGLALLAVTYIDLDCWIIPDVIVLPLAGIGLVMAIVAPDVLGIGWIEACGAGAAGYALFAGIRWIYLRFRGIEALGLGDAKLLVMVAAFTGVPGLVWTIGAGALQGVLVAIPLLRSGRKVANADLHEVHGDDPSLGVDDPDRVMGQRVPFGPFLALAALEYAMLRQSLSGWLDAWMAL